MSAWSDNFTRQTHRAAFSGSRLRANLPSILLKWQSSSPTSRLIAIVLQPVGCVVSHVGHCFSLVLLSSQGLGCRNAECVVLAFCSWFHFAYVEHHPFSGLVSFGAERIALSSFLGIARQTILRSYAQLLFKVSILCAGLPMKQLENSIVTAQSKKTTL